MLSFFYITLGVNAHCANCDGYNEEMQHVCRDLGHRSRLHYISGGPSVSECPSGYATCQQLEDGWGYDWICDTIHRKKIGTIYLKEGQQCGGPPDPYAMKRVCQHPMTCNIWPGVPEASPNPGGFGTCEYPMNEVLTTNYVGGPCGSGDSPSMHSYQCGSGLVCRGPGRERQGGYGQCQQRYSPAPPSPSPPAPSGQGQIGDTCGNGPIGFYSCQSGLQCYGAVPPNAYGTCQEYGFPNHQYPMGGRRLEETELDEAPGHLEAPLSQLEDDESTRRLLPPVMGVLNGPCRTSGAACNYGLKCHYYTTDGTSTSGKCIEDEPQYAGGINEPCQQWPKEECKYDYLRGYWDNGRCMCKPKSGPYTPAPPSPSPYAGQYQILDWGSCRGRGLEPINSIEACEMAGQHLGYGGSAQHNWRDAWRPEGCYLYQGYQLWFADNAGTYGRGAETGSPGQSRKPICFNFCTDCGGGRRLEDGETEGQLPELQAPVAEVAQE